MVSSKTPSDTQIAKSIDDVARVTLDRLVKAAYVTDEYINSEFRSCKLETPVRGFPYHLGEEQVQGMLYMLDHVRYLAVQLEQEVDRAFGEDDRR